MKPASVACVMLLVMSAACVPPDTARCHDQRAAGARAFDFDGDPAGAEGLAPNDALVAIRNGGFEEVGPARDFARNEVAGWNISGDAAAIGAIRDDAFPLYRISGHYSLFLGVDWIDGRSTTGRIWQDLCTTVPGRYYTITARVKRTEGFPLGYAIRLVDGHTGEVLAAVTERGHTPPSPGESMEIRVTYREMTARMVRLIIATNGRVGPGGALRTGIDDVTLAISAEPPPPGHATVAEPLLRRAPPTPTGKAVEIDNGRVLIRLSPMSDGVHQEFFAKHGGDWVLVARTLHPPAPYPEDAVALYDSSIDRTHRLLASECLSTTSEPVHNGDDWRVELRGSRGATTVDEIVTLRSHDPFVHIEVSVTLPESFPRLEYLLLPLEVLIDRPDYTHLPTLKRGPDALAGDRTFCAPVAMLQQGGIFAAVVPDLDVIEREVVYAKGARQQTHPRVFAVPIDPARISMPTALDLELQSGLTPRPVLAYGSIDVIANQHVWWQHPSAPGVMVRELSRNKVRFALDLFVQADAAKGRGYQVVARHHWQRYGSRYFRMPRPQAMPFAEYARICYPATFKYQGYDVAPGSQGLNHRSLPDRTDMDVWQEWESDGRTMGALRLTAPQWFNLAYNTVWWSNVCDATGMEFWGTALHDQDLIERAQHIIEFTLSAPQESGLFPSLWDLKARRWLRSLWRPPMDGYDPHVAAAYWAPDCDGVYQTAAASVTASYLLQIRRAGVDDPRILPYVRRLGDFLLAHMHHSGCVPAWFSDRLKPLPSLRTNAEGGAHIEVLAGLYRATHDRKYLAGAERMAEFLIDDILPEQRWCDFECFYSCAVKPETFRDPATGQPPRCTMSMLWALQGMLALHEATGTQIYLDTAEAVADYASLWQAIWAPHFIVTAYPFGGWTSQLGDAEWLDQRAHRFAGPLVDLGLRVGRQDLIERGIAAARSALTLANHPRHSANEIYTYTDFPVGLGPENIDHEGFPQKPLSSGPSWSTVGGLAGIAHVMSLLGGVFVDFERRIAAGVDGVRVTNYRLDGRRVILDLESALAELPRPYAEPYMLELRVVGLSAGEYELVLNGRVEPKRSAKELARLKTTWTPANR